MALGVDILEGHADRSKFEEVGSQCSADPDLLAMIGNATADLIW
jgi:hypothetical protein